MKLSIVIPNYNGIEYLKECLKALEEQTLKDFEIIVVDNGSTDGSVSFLKEQESIQLISFEKNQGFCKAVNAGIEAAKGEFVILLNNDTKASPNYAEELVKAIEADDRLFSVNPMMLSMANQEVIDDAGDLYCALGWAFARGKGKAATRYEKGKNIFASCGGASIYRKKVFQEIGLFDEAHFAYLEDLDVGYRALIHGYRNYYEPKAKILHAGSAASGSRYNTFKVDLSSANSVYVIGKNMPLLQFLLNLPLLLIGYTIKTLFFVRKGMGKNYIRGVFRGVGMIFKNRKHVPFRFKYFGNYLKIQWMLWVNTVLRFVG